MKKQGVNKNVVKEKSKGLECEKSLITERKIENDRKI